jgi:hypothetical protein
MRWIQQNLANDTFGNMSGDMKNFDLTENNDRLTGYEQQVRDETMTNKIGGPLAVFTRISSL